MHRLVRHLDMQRVAVGVRIHGDRLDPHPPRGLDDPAGDLAAVRDQDLLEHGPSGDARTSGGPADARAPPPGYCMARRSGSGA